MVTVFQTGIQAVLPERHDFDSAECLIAPSVVTDGAARALVMYQRLIETGFDAAPAMNGA